MKGEKMDSLPSFPLAIQVTKRLAARSYYYYLSAIRLEHKLKRLCSLCLAPFSCSLSFFGMLFVNVANRIKVKNFRSN
ncbi:hypothetical protein CROQUDRAFT_653644, partial [Cronartium quercuum f. sp. fusiforme G11]